MRVLHVQKATGISGSERHLLTLLPALRELGVDVRVCLLGAGDVELLVDAFRAQAVDVQVVPAGPDLNPVAVQRLRREIRRFAPDVVHTHLIHGDLHGQIVVRPLNVESASRPRTEAIRSWSASHIARRRVLRGISRWRVIAISDHVRRWVTEHRIAAPDRVRVVHYGIDCTDWELCDDRRADGADAYGVGPDNVVVGVASRLVPFKGHDVLIDSLRALDEDSKVCLLVAGDGPLRSSLEQRAAVLPPGRARFLGFVANIREFMHACDVVVFPTQPGFGEGFGLAALEAMAACRPVIASDIDSLPEIVVPGSTGLLVPRGDVAGWSSAIARLVADPTAAQAYGRAGRLRAETHFTLEGMARSTVAVYEEALS